MEKQQGNGLIYGLNDKPSFKEAFFAALQHLLAIFVAIITPPLIIAGDFNDWRDRAGKYLARRLGLREVFTTHDSHPEIRPIRSFPAGLPLFRLDRIYVRGFAVHDTVIHQGGVWAKISDHAALSAYLARNET